MSADPIRCPRCRRAFGGHFTWRRAHPNKRCRSVAGLRGIGLHRNGGGVWRRPGPADPIQLTLPIFGRGRPRKARRSLAQYSPRTANGRRVAAGIRGRARHEQLGLWGVAA
jgi:hypothetical protein